MAPHVVAAATATPAAVVKKEAAAMGTQVAAAGWVQAAARVLGMVTLLEAAARLQLGQALALVRPEAARACDAVAPAIGIHLQSGYVLCCNGRYGDVLRWIAAPFVSLKA
jgi:hypothetical protein